MESDRVAGVVRIGDPADERVADYVRLREATLRRTAAPVFIAEGELVIRRAIGAGYRPKSFLLSHRWADALGEVWGRFPDVPVFVGEADVVETVTGFHVHRGALAALWREERYDVDVLIAGSRRLVVVQDLVDHTNLGAIARTAAGLGWDGLLLSERSADPLYRRAVKASMGAVLSLPWARTYDDASLLGRLHEHGFWTVALALRDDAVDVGSVVERVGRGKVAVLLGTEGHGLSADWIRGARLVARIPMSAGVDSLNVAAAAAIGCYVLR